MPSGQIGQQTLPEQLRYDPYSHGIAVGMGSGEGDIFNAIVAPPPRDYGYDASQNQTHYIWNKPDAHWGRAAQLPETVEEYSITQKMSWMMRVFPWLPTPDLHFQWKQIENPAPLMEVTPEQATARKFGQKVRMFRRTLKRFMLSYEVEDGFIKEDYGRSMFVMAMGVIGRALIDTAILLGLRALIDCHGTTQELMRKHGYVKEGELLSYYRREAAQAFIVQKDERGIINLDQGITLMQGYWGGEADAWIFGQEVMAWLKNNRLLTEYHLGGQQAVDFLSGRQVGPVGVEQKPELSSLAPAGFVNANTPIFIAKLQHADRSATQMQILTNTLELGVFNIMVDNWTDNSKYRTALRDIEVYDNDRDDMARLRFRTALENLVVWDEKGELDESIWKSPEVAKNIQDKEYDFLSVATDPGDKSYPGNRRNITYFGEMNQSFVTPYHFLNMARTLARKACNDNEEDLKRALAAAKTVVRTKKVVTGNVGDATGKRTVTLPGATTTTTELYRVEQDEARDLLADIDEQVKLIVGGDSNLFYKNKAGAVGLMGNFVQGITVVNNGPRASGIASSVAATQAAPSVASEAEAEHKFIMEKIGELIVEGHRAEIANIAGRTELPFKERVKMATDAVKFIANPANEQRPKLVKQSFPSDPAAVESLINKRLELYQQVLPELRQRIAESSSAARMAASASSAAAASAADPEVAYIPVGASSVPSGYRKIDTRLRFQAAHLPAIQAHVLGFGVSNGRTPMRAEKVVDQTSVKTTYDEVAKLFDLKATPKTGLLNLSYMIEQILTSSEEPLIKWLACICAGIRVNRANVLKLADEDVRVPLNVANFRAHCGYLTRGAIKVGLDGKTGFMAIGGTSYKTGGEAARHTGIVTFATYLSAIVTRHKNVIPVRHIFCAGYDGGMGTEYWRAQDYKNRNGGSRRTRSILAIPLPITFEQFPDQVVDARGRFQGDGRRQLVDPKKASQPLYPGAGRVCQLLGWHDRMRYNAMDNIEDDKGYMINFICWQGIQGRATKNGTFVRDKDEQGHFGKNVGTGCAAQRRGEPIMWRTTSHYGN